jgi:hypothetical protein
MFPLSALIMVAAIGFIVGWSANEILNTWLSYRRKIEEARHAQQTRELISALQIQAKMAASVRPTEWR